MNDILDSNTYKWDLAPARELHVALCEIYPTPKAAMFIAKQAGFIEATLNPDQEASLLWQNILDRGATQARNRKLVTMVVAQNPTSPRRAFFEALLNDEITVPTDAQPRTATGDAIFLTGTTKVSEKEALLFHDDLTLTTGRVPWLIGVLQRLQKLSPAVCRFETSAPGEGQYGTGFRIADDLLLTNWHVVNFGATAATKVIAEFGFEEDAQGNGLPTKTVNCNAAPVAGDATDDWAVVRVQTPLPSTIPILKLSEGVAPTINAPAFIIQHPAGQRKRVAFVRNQITGVLDNRVAHYLSDTQAGSSGAPVFDENGRLLALHRAGGVPQEVAGKPPVKKNEGVVIARVAKGLADAGVVVP